MKGKFKTLGFFFLAFLALTVATGSASEFHSEVAHTEIRGEQHAGEDTFTFNAGTLRCNHVTYTGTESVTTSTTITLVPITTGCKAFGFVNATVDTSGCSYTFHTHPGTVATEGPGSKTIECEPGKAIVVTAFNCWITIGEQSFGTNVTYTNQGAGKGRDVTVDFNTTGIKYTQHSKSFPGCTNGTFTNGTATGAMTLRGFDTAGNQVGFWVH